MRSISTPAFLLALASGYTLALASEAPQPEPVVEQAQAAALQEQPVVETDAATAPASEPLVVSVVEAAVEPVAAVSEHVDTTVTVTTVTGQAQIKEAGAESWRGVKAGETIPVGAMIRTGLRSEVGLRLSSGSEVKIGMLSRGTVGDVLAATPNLRSTLRLDYGDVDARLARTGYKNFTVVVPERTLAVSPMLVPPGSQDTPRNTDRFSIPGQLVNVRPNLSSRGDIVTGNVVISLPALQDKR